MKTLILTGGGSAGHVVPNIALIPALREKFNLVYIGSDGIERDLMKGRGVPYHTVHCTKLVRGSVLKNIAMPFRFLKSVSEAKRALAAADAGLSGMEPLWGIPAAVGGACHQNAGAYDACIADVLETLTAYVPGAVLPDGSRGKGSVSTFGRDELAFGYRESRVATDGLVVLDAVFALVPDMEASICARMDDYQRRREEKQPLELPSAGSTFKRPAGYFAGKLIMDAGLRGYRVGGAQVSEKHCGFVVNTGGATAADVNALIEHVQAEVREQFGVELEPEVHRIGEF